MGKFKSEFKFQIGERIIEYNEDNSIKRDVTIIDKKRERDKNGHWWKYYKYNCNICSFDCGEHYNVITQEFKQESWVSEGNMKKQGCSCCCHNPQVIVKGINDIGTSHPEFINYFVNLEDIYKFSYGSSKKALLKCPNCECEKYLCLSNLTVNNRNFPCDNCCDNIPIPEKAMFNVLKQLKENNQLKNFKTQLTRLDYKWIDKFKYDFYLYDYNIIIETHGLQHYEENSNWKMSLEEVKENDNLKKKLAFDNGIKEKDYIVIDCRRSELEFIKQNILNSQLNILFDLSKIDWESLWIAVQKSIMLEACEIKKNNPQYFILDVADILNIGYQTTRSYILRGSKIGLCTYNSKEEIKRSWELNKDRTIKTQGKPVEIFKNGISLGVFRYVGELINKSNKLFGVSFSGGSISMVCNGKTKQYKGYTFKYITKEDYEARKCNNTMKVIPVDKDNYQFVL